MGDIGKMWDEKFSREDYFYGANPNVFLAKQLERLDTESHILFLGEGEGRSACYAATQGFKVEALDASRVGLSKCEERAKALGVEIKLHLADLQTYRYDYAYDAIFTSFLHLKEPLRTKAFREAFDALKHKGLFVGEFFSLAQLPRSSGGPKDSDLLYTTASLEEIFSRNNATILLLEEVEDFLDEGSGHQGDAMLIRIVVQKG